MNNRKLISELSGVEDRRAKFVCVISFAKPRITSYNVCYTKLLRALGLLVMEKGSGDIPFFAAIESAKFRKPVRPGDQLVYEVELDKMRRTMVKAHGVAKVDGQVVAEASLMFSIVKK